MLLHDLNANVPEFHSESVFVNLFKKPGTEDIAHLMHTADDLFRYLIQPRSAFIKAFIGGLSTLCK